ncbi:MAG: hypothetical protein RTU92_00870 [Candidatus Thorarchaeota archaeon]
MCQKINLSRDVKFRASRGFQAGGQLQGSEIVVVCPRCHELFVVNGAKVY